MVGILGVIDWVFSLIPKKSKEVAKGGYVSPKLSEPCVDQNLCKGCSMSPPARDLIPNLREAYPTLNASEEQYVLSDKESEIIDAINRATYLLGLDRPLRKDEDRIIVLAEAYKELALARRI